MAETSAHEPTMEEILASIRRIISEDDAPEDTEAKAAPEPVAAQPEPEPEPEPELHIEDEPEEDVLELTQTYEPAQTLAESIGDIDAYEPAPIPEPKPARAEPKMDALVSERTESTAASAFGSLSSALLVPHSDRTLEDVAKELLRPLLKQWLDQNLAGIVEQQVRLEVERIARQSRR